MSNHKMQFPFHISKSWFSVCIFIFFLAVCVGLAIHVTSEEDAICSDSDHSELPIVSNENVSEGSGSDIEYAKNYVPTEEDVLASSVTAKQLLQYDWYLGKRAKIKPGVKAKGHITYICSKGIIVNVMGAETFIKNSELR